VHESSHEGVVLLGVWSLMLSPWIRVKCPVVGLVVCSLVHALLSCVGLSLDCICVY
jgi:hypothetical protein